MKVVSWNCRGLGSHLKEEAMKYLMCISSPDVLLVQETELEEHEFIKASNLFWEKGEGVTLSARGASGGLGTLCNSSKFELIHTTTYIHWILTTLRHKDLDHLVSIFNIYVPALYSKKKILELSSGIIEYPSSREYNPHRGLEHHPLPPIKKRGINSNRSSL